MQATRSKVEKETQTAKPDLIWHHVDSFSADDFRCFEKILNTTELEGVQQAKNKLLQKTRLAARAILKKELSRRTGHAVNTLVLQFSPAGKPFLSPSSSCTVKFNLAYSRGWLVHAFSDRLELGVDLELINSAHMTPSLVADVMTEEEQRILAELPQEERLTKFFQLWTTKESVLKAAGVGLAGLSDLRTVDLDLFCCAGRYWQTSAIKAPEQFAAALAWQVPSSTVKISEKTTDKTISASRTDFEDDKL